MFAGRVFSEPEDFHNDPDLELDADDEYEDIINEKFGEEEAHGKEQGGEPPNLSEELFVCCLSKPGVVKEVKEADYVDKSIKCKDLREVYSEKEIPSRCRTVARECRGNEASTSETVNLGNHVRIPHAQYAV